MHQSKYKIYVCVGGRGCGVWGCIKNVRIFKNIYITSGLFNRYIIHEWQPLALKQFLSHHSRSQCRIKSFNRELTTIIIPASNIPMCEHNSSYNNVFAIVFIQMFWKQSFSNYKSIMQHSSKIGLSDEELSPENKY